MASYKIITLVDITRTNAHRADVSVLKLGQQANFNDKGLTLNGSFIPVGSFITSALNFVLVAFVLFALIKLYNRFRNSSPAPTTTDLLAEIRDELRKQNES